VFRDTPLMLLAGPYSPDVADLLGCVLTSAASDRLEVGLRDMDRAALALARRLDGDEQARAQRAINAWVPRR
jgi:hypothetical protein